MLGTHSQSDLSTCLVELLVDAQPLARNETAIIIEINEIVFDLFIMLSSLIRFYNINL
jgi:hypothetical protein